MKWLLLVAVLFAVAGCSSPLQNCGSVSSGDPGTLRAGANEIQRCQEQQRQAQAQAEAQERQRVAALNAMMNATATAQAIPTATSTPMPTPTTAPTNTPAPTATPEPTHEPTATAAPTSTPWPTPSEGRPTATAGVVIQSSDRTSSVPPLLLVVAGIAAIVGLVLLAPTISRWWRETSK